MPDGNVKFKASRYRVFGMFWGFELFTRYWANILLLPFTPRMRFGNTAGYIGASGSPSAVNHFSTFSAVVINTSFQYCRLWELFLGSVCNNTALSCGNIFFIPLIYAYSIKQADPIKVLKVTWWGLRNSFKICGIKSALNCGNKLFTHLQENCQYNTFASH